MTDKIIGENIQKNNSIVPPIAGALIGLIFAVGFAGGHYLGSVNTGDTWERSAIVLGYGQYCPKDGEWAWKGLCK